MVLKNILTVLRKLASAAMNFLIVSTARSVCWWVCGS